MLGEDNMKYLLYLLTFIFSLPILLGATMITTLNTYEFIYDTEYNKDIANPNMSMVLLSIESTETEEKKIPFFYDTISYDSPYHFNWILHSKYKGIKINENYILVNGEEKISLNKDLIDDGKYQNSYVFETKEQSIDIDVNTTTYIEVILDYTTNGIEQKNRYRYNLEYKKETGNRLWWAIMSV